jgi:hypothetical protein
MKLCGTYMDEYGNYHMWTSPKLREAKILARCIESNVRSSSGVEVVQIDNEIRSISWGTDSTGESWCKEINLDQVLKLIQKVAKWCVSEGMVLSPWRKYTVNEIKSADSDFKCWKRVGEGSVEVFVSKELVAEVFKD